MLQLEKSIDKLEALSKNSLFLPPSKKWITSNPLVLLLGCHSTGKSTFVNYLISRGLNEKKNIQEISVAPETSKWTVIQYSQNSEVLVDETNQFYGLYEGLKNIQNFGYHFTIKKLNSPILKNITLVDTPGVLGIINDSQQSYDVGKALKWFTDHASLILFFFGPENPGTIDVCNRNCIHLMNNYRKKSFILFNKMDSLPDPLSIIKSTSQFWFQFGKLYDSRDIPSGSVKYTSFASLENLERNKINSLGFTTWVSQSKEVVKMIEDLVVTYHVTRIGDLIEYMSKLYLHLLKLNDCLKLYEERPFQYFFSLVAIFLFLGLIILFKNLRLRKNIALGIKPLVIMVAFSFAIDSFLVRRYYYKFNNLIDVNNIVYNTELLNLKTPDLKDNFYQIGLWESIKNTTRTAINYHNERSWKNLENLDKKLDQLQEMIVEFQDLYEKKSDFVFEKKTKKKSRYLILIVSSIIVIIISVLFSGLK